MAESEEKLNNLLMRVKQESAKNGLKLDHKEGWPPKNWCFWIVVLEETLKSPLDCKENKTIDSEGGQPWVLTGRTDPEAEAPILWPSHEKRRLPGKDPDVGKVWRQEEKGITEDQVVGQCHRNDKHDFNPTPGGSGRREGLVCSGPWGHEESDTQRRGIF